MPRTAGVLLLGTGGSMPAHSTTYFETACAVEDQREVPPFAFRTHTHSMGRVVSGWRVRGEEWTLIGKKDPQLPQVPALPPHQPPTLLNFPFHLSSSPFMSTHQMFYPLEEPLILVAGDNVAARCTMVNTRDRCHILHTNQLPLLTKRNKDMFVSLLFSPLFECLSPRVTEVGPTGEDEMCNFYLMYWVEGRDTIQPNTCFTRGPPTW